MNKRDLVQELITKLFEAADTASRGSKSARQASIEAPSKMESRYDSTKSEQDWLSHALAVTNEQTRKEIKEIQAVDLTPSKRVKVGSLVTTKEEGNENVERYFILLAGSGSVLQKGTPQQTTVVTPKSPAGLALMGNTAGNRCEVKTPKGPYHLFILSVE